MKQSKTPALFIGVLLAAATASAQSYVTMVDNGPSSNRVDMVFIGDGYLATQIETVYVQHVQAQINYFFDGNRAPFPRYRNFFNVHRVNIASNETGADQPPLGIFRDTALDASYWWDGVTERLLYFNVQKANTAVNTALSGSGITPNVRLGVVNDPKYGGGGGNWAVYAGANSSALDIALHEIGHSFGGLADEYFTSGVYNGPEPSEPNVTKSPATGKWDRWLGYNDPETDIGPIDYYEGARYFQFGLFRPSVNSEMRSLYRPFDAISRERFISRIYDQVRPLDGWTDNNAVLVNPSTLAVQTVDPDVLRVEWRVNDSSLGVLGETLDLSSLGLLGSHTITARAYDAILDYSFSGGPLDWWRLPDTQKLQQSITWQVIFTPGDFNGDGSWDCHDIDALVAQIVAGAHDPMFDLNGDGLVNHQDLPLWLSFAGTANLGLGLAYLPGDANLDGVVDGADFVIWNTYKFTELPAWCHGDFNADGAVDGQDFVIWNTNKFLSSNGATPIPEPHLGSLSGFVCWWIMNRERRRKWPKTSQFSG